MWIAMNVDCDSKENWLQIEEGTYMYNGNWRQTRIIY